MKNAVEYYSGGMILFGGIGWAQPMVGDYIPEGSAAYSAAEPGGGAIMSLPTGRVMSVGPKSLYFGTRLEIETEV